MFSHQFEFSLRFFGSCVGVAKCTPSVPYGTSRNTMKNQTFYANLVEFFCFVQHGVRKTNFMKRLTSVPSTNWPAGSNLNDSVC